MATDAYLYKPLDSSLIERIDKEERIHKKTFNVIPPFVELIEPEDIACAHLSFGKYINMPFGTQNQGPEEKDGTMILVHLVALVVDGPNTHLRGYKKQIEKEMLKKLGLDDSAVKYLGIYSGDRAKLVTDF